MMNARMMNLVLGAVLGSVVTFTLYSQFGMQRLGTALNGYLVAAGVVSHPKQTFVRTDWLNGSPTARFRDNLRNDTQYMTTFFGGGITNDIMTIGNMIYLAMQTDRVPIIPPWLSYALLDGSVNYEPLPFGEVFDVPALERELGHPVLQWHEVKDTVVQPPPEEREQVGCWNVWGSVEEQRGPAWSGLYDRLGLDISWNFMPKMVSIGATHASLWKIASLLYPTMRQRYEAEIVPQPSQVNNALLKPDEQLACYDLLYYLSASEWFEMFFDYSPVWRFVVSNFRWTARIDEIGQHYIRSMLGVPPHTPTPPYIAVHARHGDFGDICDNGGVSQNQCLVSLPAIQRRVSEVQTELRETKGIIVDDRHVIVTSDETGEQFWNDVRALGWTSIDHHAMRTVEQYGEWYPLIVDVYIQGSGVGFVGTARSTMSLLAKRRTEDWQGGVTRMVEWGREDADNH